jgi:hypothetical protein
MATSANVSQSRDVFVSHASEDKDAIARPLVNELVRRGLSVWFDEHELLLGDPLRRRIDEGLAQSTIGVVILSHDFFAKEWPQLELDGLHARLTAGEKNVIVPVWHDLTKQDLVQYSPLLADLLGGRSTDGVGRLADEIERVLKRRGGAVRTPKGRRKRLTRKAAVQPVATVERARTNPTADPIRVLPLPKKSADPIPALPPEERAQGLAEGAVRSLEQHHAEIPVTIMAGDRLVAELSKRGDGVVTIRSRFLSPQQRVLLPVAKTEIRELTISTLKHLTPGELSRVEVRSPPDASSELPPRVLASEDQVKMSQTLAAALKKGADRRLIKLREDRGSLSLRRTGQTVKMSVSRSYEPAQASSFSLADVELADRLLAGLTAVSRRKTFGEGRLEDSFSLSDLPSYSKLRVLTEQVIGAGGQFALWQRFPAQRFALKVRKSRRGELIIECPGSVPSVERFEVRNMMAFVETLESVMGKLLTSHADALEVFATGMLVDLGPDYRPDPRPPRRRFGRISR